jgi:hypothetical protein
VAAVRTPILLLSALLLLSLVPPGNAGSSTVPEISDGPDDQAVGGVVPIATQPPAGTTVGLNVDLLAGWVAETADSLLLTVQVHGTGSPSTSSSTTWVFHFDAGGKTYDASAVQDLAEQASGKPGTGAVTPGGVATGAVAAGDHLIVLTVPKSAIGSPAAGAILSKLSIDATGKTAGQAGTIKDRAPDSGAGADYVLTGGGLAKTLHGTIDTPTVDLAQGFVNATSAHYLYNWTQGPANATVHLAVHGTGNATVQVRDAANATVVTQALRDSSVTLNVTGKAGRWTIAINYTAFKGNLTLSIAPRAVPVPVTTGTGTPSASPGTTSRTATGGTGTTSSTTKGTPAAGALLLLAGLGAAVAAARRRAT